ncbi:hypothetical protein IWW50_000475 [Coemansia erecta]|nr:hypothetical protein IWW50_000475 [Coemansia erecta]
MTSNEELQKRVDVLQRQLRKAGDHLKRLASENGTLTEQVERLTTRESQLQAQAQELSQTVSEQQANADDHIATGARKEQRISELETQISEMKATNDGDDTLHGANMLAWEEAREWAKQLGVELEADMSGPKLLQAIRAHVDSAQGSKDAEQLAQEISQLRIDAAQELESKQRLEASIAELESKLKLFAESEAGLARVLDSIGDIDKVPETVPESMRAGLERVIRELSTQRGAASDHAQQQEKQIADLESQLKDAQTELGEATQAREELGRDYDLLLERIGTMRDALKAKMNAESDELKRLRSEAATAAREAQEVDELRRALWESQEVASRQQYEQREATEAHERQERELRARVAAAEEQAESDAHQNAQLEERIELLQGELNAALNAESQWVEAREVHVVTIQNLQSALETLQAAKDADVDMAVEQLRDDLRQSVAAQRAAEARAAQAEARLRKIELSGATAEQSQQKIAGQGAELERLRHEVAVLKDHLNESMRRLREESSEFNLDKRVITNLIVGFLAMPYGDSKRFEILQLMSSILQFSEEQQEKVGLIRKAGRRVPVQESPGTPTSESSTANGDTKESFSDQWISYLLRESSRTRARQQ